MKGSYVIVKFVPDEVRFEPINVGLVVQVGDEIVTRMSDTVDPRIRFADPYLDLHSLRDFLLSFDARDQLERSSDRAIGELQGSTIPHIYFASPRTVDS